MADDGFDIEVTGLDELDRRMEAFAPQFNRDCVQRGVYAGGTVLRESAKVRAPTLRVYSKTRQGGELRDSIDVIMDPVSGDSPSRVGCTISPTYDKSEGAQSPGVYGKFVEYGSVHNQPMPFLRPAIDEDGELAINECISATGAAMDEMTEAPMVNAA